jgi:peptidoglycan-N-acetylglucosamine deacetylase
VGRATVALTFDNLGEAAELQLGAEPERGAHASVHEALPRVLKRLGQLGLPATFFVEGINAETYPDALHSIADAGHEVAYHSWCHERWGTLSPEEEAENVKRGVGTLRALGLEPSGFRPPGGELSAHTAGVLRDNGLAYASPEAGQQLDGIACLPFEWPHVDAFYVLPQFAEQRDAEGPEAARDALVAALDAQTEGHLTLILHPFLQLDPAFAEAMDAVLERAADCDCVRMAEAAA